jgi:hypothetical protein
VRKLTMVRDERPEPAAFSLRVDQDQGAVRYDFACENCGYGVHVATSPLPLSCPMCRRFDWASPAAPLAGPDPWSGCAA